MRYLLDTTVIIDHVNGLPAGMEIVGRLFEETGAIFTCDIVTCEALSKGDELQREAATTLLDALEYVAIDPDGARWAGEQRRALAAAGRRHPAPDALIAAAAWRIGATVVTRNASDFERFGIPVLGYGEGGAPAMAGTKRGSTR